jgi:hypothetical protein
MTINDRVYGEINIIEPVLLELINTKAMQRLKEVSQDGATHLIQPARNVTRYEHSLGVWYLAQYFHCSLKEQIACLLHDISHTAFSHVIDCLMKTVEQDYAEKLTKQFVKNTEIPEILNKFKIRFEDIFNKNNFPLLNNELPDISFDRLDYFLRDAVTLNFLPLSVSKSYLMNLSVDSNVLYFSDLSFAANFSILFMNCSRLCWTDPTGVGSYYLLAEAMRLGLAMNLISEADFYNSEISLLTKLRKGRNSQINTLLDRLSPGKEFINSTKESAEFFGKIKSRFVDPLVKTETGLKRVSELTYSLGTYFKEFSDLYKISRVKPQNQ